MFADDDVQHVHNKLDPKHDIEVINGELILADLQTIDNHLPKLAKLAKSDKLAAKQMAEIEKLQQKLNDEVLAINAGIDLELIKHLNLLTAKPFIYVFNIDEKDINNIAKQEELAALAPAESVFVSAKIEAELSQIEEAGDLMAEYGLEETGLERLSEVGYSTLGLQSFLTTGEKETRAWTIRKGTTAPEAAGVIHTDFEKGFIKAEVVSYPKIVEAGSWLEARNNGWVRTEGREYIMQPDDVVEFKINKTTT